MKSDGNYKALTENVWRKDQNIRKKVKNKWMANKIKQI